jgi:hypothetical protein
MVTFDIEITPELAADEGVHFNFKLTNPLIFNGLSADYYRLALVDKTTKLLFGVNPPPDHGNHPKEPPINTSKAILNNSSKAAFVIGSTVVLTSAPIFSNFGISFIKMFQVIEIFSKLIYLPVRFSGPLQKVLNSICGLSDPLQISPTLLIDGELDVSYNKYKGKIYRY